MRKIIIYKPRINAKRIKVYIPYESVVQRKAFKAMNSTYWHPHQKLWSIVNTEKNMRKIMELFGDSCMIEDVKTPTPLPSITLNSQSTEVLYELEKRLVLKQYSQSTIKIYKRMLVLFLGKFQNQELSNITKYQIESFVFELIQKNKISESFQNQLINAIKAYYEQVLGMPREFYDIQRPKTTKTLPNVLSKEEVLKILQHPQNIKHKAILWTIYGGGLRISELINLRIDDIRSKEGNIFVKGAKGKKDRKTVLPLHLLTLLREYYLAYKPAYWLFEGQTGGKYSVTSVRNIFRKAVKATNSNAWATVHTLRHSFATHSVENNIHMRNLQEMLGHSSPKTTELYTKLIQINNKNIISPLDDLLKNDNLQT